MANFHTILTGIDVKPILEQVNKHSELWNQHRYRTRTRILEQCDDIILRYTANVDDWLECIDYPAMHILSEAKRVAHTLQFSLQCDRMGRVMITRLAPGNKILPHKDTENIDNLCSYYRRFHICLKDNQHTAFICDGERFRPNVGDVYWFDNAKIHSVENNGDSERLTMIVDLKIPTMKVFYGPGEDEEPPAPPDDVQIKSIPSKVSTHITYQKESIVALKDELDALFVEHYKAIALDQDLIPKDMDWDKYTLLEKAKAYAFYTIRDDGHLIGYWGGTVGGHLHYKSTMHASTDIFWISPEYRQMGLGSEFFARIEEFLKLLGVKKFMVFFKDHQPHQKFFERMGYKPSDIAYYKML